MAKKINTKVAVIGVIIFASITMLIVAGLLAQKWRRSPSRYISRAESRLAELANIPIDLQSEELVEKYQKAAGDYVAAFSNTKKADKQIEYLQKAIEIFNKVNAWDSVIACYGKIVTVDPQNWNARNLIIDYFKTRAESGEIGVWQHIGTTATETIKAKEDAGVEIDPNLYYLKGKALFYSAVLGSTADSKNTIAEAIEFMQKAIDLSGDQTPVEQYNYLAQAIVAQGQMQQDAGILNALDKAKEKANELLSLCIEKNPQDPKAYINAVNISAQGTREALIAMEPEFLTLTQKFPESADAQMALANYYSRIGKQQQALEYSSKALAVDPENIDYIIASAKLSHDNYLITKQTQYRDKAVELAQKALQNPKAQDVPDITRAANINRKVMMHSLLAQIHIEDALDEKQQDAKKQNIESAQENIHQIKQVIASPDSPMVLKWDGLLSLASGNTLQATNQLYQAYEKFKAANTTDSLVSYYLAKIFENSTETGLLMEFLNSALSQTDFLMTRPDVLLNYVAFLNQISPASALNALDAYENIFGHTDKTRNIKFSALVSTGQTEKAQELISDFDKNDPNLKLARISLLTLEIQQNSMASMQMQQSTGKGSQQEIQAQDNIKKTINNLLSQKSDIVFEVLKANPELVSMQTFTELYQYCQRNNQIEKAGQAIEMYKAVHPDDVSIKFFSKILLEPDPNNISADRQLELREQAISELDDPLKRLISLGSFYAQTNQADKAINSYQAALKIDPNNAFVMENIFNISLTKNDIETANKIARTCGELNIDQCQGLSYQARLSMVKKDYSDALEKINKCIEEKPLNSGLYLIRSRIYLLSDKLDEATEDARKTIKYNPFSPEYSRNLALLLYQRNTKLGDSLNSEQRIETRNALQNALNLNRNDLQLQIVYADVIAQTEQDKAIALLQNVQRMSPSAENLTRIAMLSMQIVERTVPALPENLQKPFYEIAEASLNQAIKLDAKNEDAVKLYVTLLQKTGREKEAETFIKEDRSLLWRFYIQGGKYDKAKEILDTLYSNDQKNEELLKGLLLIAEKTSSQNDVIKYSDALVKIAPDNMDNNLLQIRGYIETGLIDEASNKINSLLERGQNDMRLYLFKALICTRNSQLDEALKTVNTALTNDPESAQGWQLKGQICSLLGNFEDAIDSFKRSKAINPTPEVKIDLAKAYLQTNQKNNAVVELGSAIESPQSPRLAWLILEDIYLRGGRENEIVNFYEKAIAAFADSPVWYNKCASYYLSNKNYDLAAGLFDKGWQITQPQGNFESFSGYLSTLIEAQKFNEAVSFASKYIDSDYSVPAFLVIANAKYKSGDTEAAIGFANKAIDRVAENYIVISNVADYIGKNIDKQLAMDLITDRYNQNQNSAYLTFAMYKLNIDDKQYLKAIEFLDKTISLNKDQNAIDFLESHKLSALQTAYQDTKNDQFFDLVTKEYEAALQKRPDDVQVLNNLAYMLASTDVKLEQSLKYAEKAYNKLPNNPGIMDTYAFVLIKTGDYQKALNLLIRAKQLFEKDSANAPADFYDHFAIVNEKLGNNDVALKNYETALDLGKDSFTKKDIERIKQAITSIRNN
jgi:tetratricopeptide (TPR) repeat protein